MQNPIFLAQLSYAALVAAALLILNIFIILDRRSQRQQLSYVVGDVVRCTRDGEHYTGAITELLASTRTSQPRYAVIAVASADPDRCKMVMVRYRSINGLARPGRA